MQIGIGIGVNTLRKKAADLPPEPSDFITNGGFDTDTGWTKTGGTTIDAGHAIYTGSLGGISQTLLAALRIGNNYNCTFTVEANPAGAVVRVLAGGDIIYEDVPLADVISVPFVAVNGTDTFSIRDVIGDGIPGLLIDDVNLVPVEGD